MLYVDGPTKNVNFRATEDEIERWKDAAGKVPFSVWCRDVLNAAAVPMPAVSPTRVFTIEEKAKKTEISVEAGTVKMVPKKTPPKKQADGKMCIHRNPPGVYCGRCERGE